MVHPQYLFFLGKSSISDRRTLLFHHTTLKLLLTKTTVNCQASVHTGLPFDPETPMEERIPGGWLLKQTMEYFAQYAPDLADYSAPVRVEKCVYTVSVFHILLSSFLRL